MLHQTMKSYFYLFSLAEIIYISTITFILWVFYELDVRSVWALIHSK